MNTRCVFSLAFMAILSSGLPPVAQAAQPAPESATNKGVAAPTIQAKILVGPFDLKRKYESMQGPYNYSTFKIGDLIASKQTIVPESAIEFNEKASKGANPLRMGGQSASAPVKADQTRTLYWITGIKGEVLDEQGKPMPTAEFFCHYTVDLDPHLHNKLFPQAERCYYGRLFTLTQGQTEIQLPEGFGIPVASEEPLTMMFQAVNRTTNAHRRVKHRFTYYLVKDSDLKQPLKAVHWQVPYMSTVVSDSSPEMDAIKTPDMPDCSTGVVCAPIARINPGFVLSDAKGRKRAGHWLVPPGLHTYKELLAENNQVFWDQPRRAHLVWSHLHPLCTEASLVRSDGSTRTKLFTVRAKTLTKPGLQVENIALISSKDGILLPPGGSYEMEVTYNNTTGLTQDSMASFGILMADNKFVRPDWAVAGSQALSHK